MNHLNMSDLEGSAEYQVFTIMRHLKLNIYQF